MPRFKNPLPESERVIIQRIAVEMSVMHLGYGEEEKEAKRAKLSRAIQGLTQPYFDSPQEFLDAKAAYEAEFKSGDHRIDLFGDSYSHVRNAESRAIGELKVLECGLRG